MIKDFKILNVGSNVILLNIKCRVERLKEKSEDLEKEVEGLKKEVEDLKKQVLGNEGKNLFWKILPSIIVPVAILGSIYYLTQYPNEKNKLNNSIKIDQNITGEILKRLKNIEQNITKIANGKKS